MIHTASLESEQQLIFLLFSLSLDGQTICVKTIISIGRDNGSVLWINIKVIPILQNKSTLAVILLFT